MWTVIDILIAAGLGLSVVSSRVSTLAKRSGHDLSNGIVIVGLAAWLAEFVLLRLGFPSCSLVLASRRPNNRCRPDLSTSVRIAETIGFNVLKCLLDLTILSCLGIILLGYSNQ